MTCRLWLPALGFLFSCAPTAARSPETRWYKGNTHAHTLWDNGDALPEEVASWYRDRGYHFVVLSDHNENNAISGDERWIEGRSGCVPLKTFDRLRSEVDREGRFLLLPGEEIGDSFQGKLIHHNAVNVARVVRPPGGISVRDEMKRAVDAAASRTSIVHLNHPNLGWAVSAEDLAAVEEERFFEVYNGNPAANDGGDARHPATDEMWDRALAARLRAGRGPLLYGVATDDAHHYSGKGPARPGRGWIMVRARELSAEALVAAMSAGEFYATTGVLLDEVRADARGLSIKVVPRADVSTTIRFIGTRGESVGIVLREVKASEASYEFEGDELYVRAVVLSSRPQGDPAHAGDLERAWIQPVRRESR